MKLNKKYFFSVKRMSTSQESMRKALYNWCYDNEVYLYASLHNDNRHVYIASDKEQLEDTRFRRVANGKRWRAVGERTYQ